MNEYHKIRVLDMGIEELRKALLTIAGTTFGVSSEERDAIFAHRKEITDAITAMAAKRKELIMNTASGIAGIDPVEI